MRGRNKRHLKSNPSKEDKKKVIKTVIKTVNPYLYLKTRTIELEDVKLCKIIVKKLTKLILQRKVYET